VAEGARLESVYTGNRIVGSNPTPSAKGPVRRCSPAAPPYTCSHNDGLWKPDVLCRRCPAAVFKSPTDPATAQLILSRYRNRSVWCSHFLDAEFLKALVLGFG
jgi:hypothetical protein